jgi:hypothetical protein
LHLEIRGRKNAEKLSGNVRKRFVAAAELRVLGYSMEELRKKMETARAAREPKTVEDLRIIFLRGYRVWKPFRRWSKRE